MSCEFMSFRQTKIRKTRDAQSDSDVADNQLVIKNEKTGSKSMSEFIEPHGELLSFFILYTPHLHKKHTSTVHARLAVEGLCILFMAKVTLGWCFLGHLLVTQCWSWGHATNLLGSN